MLMKVHRILIPFMMFFLASCGQEEKKANELLSRAESSFQSANYSEAKLLIDSIRNSYPKVFDVRRKAIMLKQQVELKEQQISLEYLDSMMAVKQLALLFLSFASSREEYRQNVSQSMCKRER